MKNLIKASVLSLALLLPFSTNISAAKFPIVDTPTTPTIEAEDRVFFLMTELNNKELLKYVKVTDISDPGIRGKLQIIGLENVDVTKPGDYVITYSVTNRFNMKAQQTVKITILDELDPETSRFVRFIDKDTFEDTVPSNSKWKVNADLETKILSTLNKEVSDENCKYIYIFSDEDVDKIKDTLNEQGFGKNSNANLIEKFAYCRKA